MPIDDRERLAKDIRELVNAILNWKTERLETGLFQSLGLEPIFSDLLDLLNLVQSSKFDELDSIPFEPKQAIADGLQKLHNLLFFQLQDLDLSDKDNQFQEHVLDEVRQTLDVIRTDISFPLLLLSQSQHKSRPKRTEELSHQQSLIDLTSKLNENISEHADALNSVTERLRKLESEIENIREGSSLLPELQERAEATARSLREFGDLSGLVQKLQSRIAETESALATARTTAQQSGVQTHEGIFNTEAEENGTKARHWMYAGWVFFSLTLTAAVLSMVSMLDPMSLFALDDPSNLLVIEYIAAKLVILSVLTFGTVWCAKNHRARMHNFTLCRHRRNALRTFRTFVEGAGDSKEVQNAILLFCAEAAFSNRPTGYDAPDGDSGQQQFINPIVDLMGKASHG